MKRPTPTTTTDNISSSSRRKTRRGDSEIRVLILIWNQELYIVSTA